MTRLAARAVLAGRATSHAESGFRVARTLAVALQHRLGTADQRVAAEPGVTAALHPVVDDLTLGARAARRGSVAGRCVQQDGSRVTYNTPDTRSPVTHLGTVCRCTLRCRDTTCRCGNRPRTDGSRISDSGRRISSPSYTPPCTRRRGTVRRTNTPRPCDRFPVIPIIPLSQTIICDGYSRPARRLARRRITRPARTAVAVSFATDQRVPASEQRVAFERHGTAALFLVV